jgi:hypothetical protein
MKNVKLNQLLAYELSGGDFGTQHEFRGFVAQMADKPLAYSFAELADTEGSSGREEFYRRFTVCLVPHRLALLRRKGLSEPISVGMEIEYLNGQKTCSVLGLFPSFEFRTVGGVGAEFSANANLGGNLALPDGSSSSDTATQIGQLSVGVRSKGEISLNLKCRVVTPKVMAVGVGSDHCEWRFDLGETPLYGKDLETWSFLALPKGQRTLKYRMRFYVVTRFAFVPLRFQSEWEEVQCDIVTSLGLQHASGVTSEGYNSGYQKTG